jgi:hypothetical protein
VLGLDTWQIQGGPTSVRPDFDPTILQRPGEPATALRAWLARLRLTFSLDTLGAAVATLRAQDDALPDWWGVDGQRLGEVFFRQVDDEYRSAGQRDYFLAIDRREIGFKLPAEPREAAGPAGPPKPPPENSFDYIRRIVAFCRDHRIDLRIYITPAHAHQMELSAMMGEWSQIEGGKRRLVALLDDDARRRRAPPFPLWDFSGYSSVTTEPLPPRGGEMRFYWDSSHFKAEVGDWVLDRLLGVSRAGHPTPADFGRPLTAQTVDAVLGEERQGRDAYEASHPSDVATLKAMLAHAAAVASRPGP